MLTVPGRVDRVEADEARLERLRAAGAVAAVVRPAGRCPWWADEDHEPAEPAGAEAAGGPVWASRFPLRRRRARLAAQVREALPGGGAAAVLAAGFPAWAEALALGRALDAGVLLGAREEAAVPAARRLLRAVNPTRCVVAAETEALAERLRAATDNLLVVEVVPACVPARARTGRRRGAGAPLLVAVPLDAAASGLAPLLAGLSAACGVRPAAEVQLLLLGEAAALRAGHAAAAAAGRLGAVSAAPAVGPDGCRASQVVPLWELLAGVDAVARPFVAPVEEPPVGLEAAARGLPVLAPRGEAATPPGVARELPAADAEAWAAGFAWLLDDAEGARLAGAAARERVRAGCGVEASDTALLHLAGLVGGA